MKKKQKAILYSRTMRELLSVGDILYILLDTGYNPRMKLVVVEIKNDFVIIDFVGLPALSCKIPKDNINYNIKIGYFVKVKYIETASTTCRKTDL